MKKNSINLLPPAIKSERFNATVKKSLYVLALIPLGLYGFTQYSMTQIQNEINTLQGEISAATVLERSIEQAETTLFNETRIHSRLATDGFPLHRFLLSTGVVIPEDMRLFEIISDNFLEENQVTEEELLEKEKLRQEQLNGIQEGQLDENGNPIEVPTEEVEEEIKGYFAEQKTLYIRGTAISVNSIGEFMSSLEENGYIEKVDIKDIQNYYNGAHSYKFFELYLELR